MCYAHTSAAKYCLKGFDVIENKVSQKNLTAVFAKYVSLSILGMLGISCYIIADTIFIERAKGAEGLAALNFAIPMFNFMNAVALMAGVGWSARFAIQKGTGDDKAADRTFTQGFKLAVAAGIVFAVSGFFLSGFFASVMGAERGTEIHRLASEYLRVLLSFSPLFMLNSLISSFIRNDGAPHLAMAATVTGSLSNILLDYIFIFPMNMGMFGASLATGCSPLISLAVMSFYFIRHKNTFGFSRGRTTFKDGFKNCSLGFSSFLAEVSSGIVVFSFNRVILSIAGDDGVAAYGVIANTAMVGVAVFNGIAQGMQPLTGRFYGEGSFKTVKRCYRMTVITGLCMAALIYAAVYGFTDEIASAFNSGGNADIATLAHSGLRLYFLAFVPLGFNTITALYYASIAKPVPSFAISVSRGLVLTVPFLFILSSAAGINGVWLTLLFSEGITAAAVIAFKAVKLRRK